MRFRHCGALACAVLLAAAPVAARERAPLAPGVHQRVVNDVRLWYRVAGRGDGIPVVFLHGGPGQGSQSFAALAGPAMERSHRMVYLDQRGCGRSERPWDGAYSLDALLEDLEALTQEDGERIPDSDDEDEDEIERMLPAPL